MKNFKSEEPRNIVQTQKISPNDLNSESKLREVLSEFSHKERSAAAFFLMGMGVQKIASQKEAV